MNPKKGIEFIPDSAQKQGIPEQDLKDIVTGYFTSLKNAIVNMEGVRIEMLGIGKLSLSVKRANKSINNKKRSLDTTEQIDSAIDILDKIERLQSAVEEKRKRNSDRKVIKRKARAINKFPSYEPSRNTPTGMEEPGTDT